MDSSEAFHDDGTSTEVSGLEGGVFSTAAFTVVLVSNHHPWHVLRLQGAKWCYYDIQ